MYSLNCDLEDTHAEEQTYSHKKSTARAHLRNPVVDMGY